MNIKLQSRIAIFVLAISFLACGRSTVPRPTEPVLEIEEAKEPEFVFVDLDSSPAKASSSSSTIGGNDYWHAGEAHKVLETRVVWVSDGDTFRTEDGLTIRMLGVNTPEIPHPDHGKPTGDPFGEEAKAYTLSRIKDQRVTLVIPTDVEHDRYGRTLALVFRDSKLVNVELIQNGLARILFMDNSYLLKTEAWYQLQKIAKEKKLGLWSVADRKPLAFE